MYLYMTCICLYTVLCCKKAERSRIDKQIRELEINSPDGTDVSPNANAQGHMVLDEEQYNRNPALYGKHPHQRAISYEDYYRANYGTAEINTGSESELEYEHPTNQLGTINREHLRSPQPDDSWPQNQNSDTEPNHPLEGLPMGMNQRHYTEPNNRQLALANLSGQKDPDSDTPSED